MKIMKITEDVTKRKKEEALRTSKDYLNNIINCIGFPVFVKDDNFRFVLANDALCSMLGIERKNIIGRTLGESLPNNQMNHFLKVDKMVLKSGQENSCEEPLTGHDGKILTIITKKTRYVDEQGNKFLVGVIRDITKRKKVEEALKKIEEKYNAILDYSSDQIFMIDKNLKFISVNNCVAKSLGKKPEDIINKSLKDVFNRPDEATKFASNIKKALGGESQRIEGEITLQGKKNVISTQLNPVKDSSGAVTAVLGIARNITARKIIEEELKKSKDILQSKVKELERFNKLAIDRELRMIELKEKIKELERKLGKK